MAPKPSIKTFQFWILQLYKQLNISFLTVNYPSKIMISYLKNGIPSLKAVKSLISHYQTDLNTAPLKPNTTTSKTPKTGHLTTVSTVLRLSLLAGLICRLASSKLSFTATTTPSKSIGVTAQLKPKPMLIKFLINILQLALVKSKSMLQKLVKNSTVGSSMTTTFIQDALVTTSAHSILLMS